MQMNFSRSLIWKISKSIVTPMNTKDSFYMENRATKKVMKSYT